MQRYVLAIDEGTTGVRAHIFDEASALRGAAYQEVTADYPQPGWVEQDPEAIWRATSDVCGQALERARLRPADLAAVGICNQRSTTLVWERKTSRPLSPAIVWQDVRTAPRVAELMSDGMFTNTMASATKLEWMLHNIPDGVQRAAAGELCFGTMDTWLAWKLSGGKVHVTDYSNASCTTLFDVLQAIWDVSALQKLGIPNAILPRAAQSSEIYGTTDASFGAEVPIAGMAGDQQAAMFGALCVDPGSVKITFGTSAMADVHTGEYPVISLRGAYPLILWGIGGQRAFCLEGTTVTAGAAVQWLRDGLGVLRELDECGPLAMSVPDSGGVWAVPAFQGLGTPHMDPAARAVIGGLSRGSTRAHIVRAVLEGIACRSREVLTTLLEDSATPAPVRLRVNGGAAANDFLLQHLANILGITVERPQSLQASALGAAYLAGLATGVWSSIDELRQSYQVGRTFEPQWTQDQRDSVFEGWQRKLHHPR